MSNILKDNIPPVDIIIKEALNVLKNDPNFSNMSFSEKINALEENAHRIYLEKERHAIYLYLKNLIGQNTGPLDEIIEFISIKVQELIKIVPNIRRSRAGRTAEKILHIALKEFAGIESQVIIKKSRKSYYPDLVVPCWEEYEKQPEKTVVIAVKRTLRERWREDISIFREFKHTNPVFVCISNKTDFGRGKIKAMVDAGMRRVYLPDKIYIRYEKDIMTVEHKKNEKIFYKLSELPEYLKKIVGK